MKKLLSIILTLTMFFSVTTVLAAPATASAKSNVTRSMSKNKNFKKLVKRISTYCIGDSFGKKGTTTVKNNNKTRLSVAAYVRYHIDRDFDYTKAELKKTVKDLFGKDVKKIQCSGFLMKSTTGYAYAGGDFGTMQPKYKISKVTKSGKNYTATIIGKIYEVIEKKTTKQCKITLKFKKSGKSAFNYVATKIKYKKY